MEIQKLAKQYIYWPEIDNKHQKNFNLSNVKVSEIHDMLDFASEQPKESVTVAIAKFYCLNEMLAKLRQNGNDVLDLQAIQLYKKYTTEIEKLSQQMFSYIFTISVMEARHCNDYKSIKRNLVDLHDKYYGQNDIILKKNNLFRKKLLKDYYRSSFTNLKDYKAFCLVHTLIEPLSDLTDYERTDVNESFIPLLKDSKYSDLTLSQILNSLTILFNNNHFKHNYGGKAWASISSHGEKFVSGELNAEVFVDQAFSLEHNGGQIFNKALIFKHPSKLLLSSVKVLSFGIDSESKNIYETQLLLNMQHQGQLLDFLLLPLKELVAEDVANEESWKRAVALQLIPNLSYVDYRHIVDTIHSNIDELYRIQKHVIHNDSFSEILTLIKDFNLPRTPLKTLPVFNHLTSEYGSFHLYDRSIPFHNFQDKLIEDFNIPNLTLVDNAQDIPFTFEKFDTSAIPVDKMKKEILGNKAFGLAEMQTMNLPVPKALVFPATNSASFFNHKTEWNLQLNTVLPEMKEYFKDNEGNPLLCSIRSGSAISMPGMMDTILNVGIDDSNYEQFSKTLGRGVTNQCAIKFMTLFTKSLTGEDVKYSSTIVGATNKFKKILTQKNIPHSTTGLFPLTAEHQYKLCLQTVFDSWNSERATAYRNYQNISHDIGTAAIAQQMVFGNLNNKSCTGVAFSRDCISGEKGIIGEFLPKAQGEDVVSGAVTPLNIKEMSQQFPEAYEQLVTICERLEKDTGDIQDIEFTVENKKLYILQKRKAVSSDLATTKLNFELMEKGLISEQKMLEDITINSLIPQDCVDSSSHKPSFTGLVANPGVMRGIIIRNENEMIMYKDLYDTHSKDSNFGWIFYAPETSPEHAPIMIKTHAFITSNGGFTSHAAILARSWKKPCVVGIGTDNTSTNLASGKIITLDATNGKIYDNFLPIISNRNNEVKKIVKTLLKHHNVNLKSIRATNPFNELINEINSSTTWRQNLADAKLVKPTIKPNLNSFLKLGDKIAILLLKAQKDKKNNLISSISEETHNANNLMIDNLDQEVNALNLLQTETISSDRKKKRVF